MEVPVETPDRPTRLAATERRVEASVFVSLRLCRDSRLAIIWRLFSSL
jgi:hypothetical protein